jgi:predicted glutamine amidotransferase
MIVSNENCHPFTYKDYTFMHNGGIPSFQTIKLKILNLLSPETLANIKGTTDTEHIFAIYLNCLPHREEGQQHTVAEMVDAMNQTISIVLQLCAENGIKDHCSLNLCVTNGVHVIATRFRSGPKAPPSLYYNIGANFVCRNGHFYAEDATSATEIVISSAPLSKVCQHQEVEQDASFAEDGEHFSGLGTPTGRNSLGGAHRTGNSASGGVPGIRPNLSTNSLRALLAPSAQALSQQGNDADQGETDGDSDIGSWILIPRNHMLVCQGSAQEPHRLESVYLEHIAVTPPHCALKHPLNACKRKADTVDPVLAQWASAPGTDLQLTGAGAGQPLQKRQCTGECTFTVGDEELSDGTTTLSASTSVSSTDGLARHDSASSETSAGAAPRTGCIGVAFSPNCKLKPKVIKFTCQM